MVKKRIARPKLISNKKGKKVFETPAGNSYSELVPRDRKRKGINFVAWINEEGKACCTYQMTDMTYAEKAVLLTELEYVLEKIKRKHFDHALEIEEIDDVNDEKGVKKNE